MQVNSAINQAAYRNVGFIKRSVLEIPNGKRKREEFSDRKRTIENKPSVCGRQT